MPRRTVTRCLPKGDVKQLTCAEEWAIIHTQGIGPETLEQYRELWSAHGETLLKKWKKEMPGSRPWPMYFLGLLPPLPAIHPTEQARPFRIGSRDWYSDWHHGKSGYPELDHLLAHGVIDEDEAEAGRKRIEQYGASTAPWVWISRGN